MPPLRLNPKLPSPPPGTPRSVPPLTVTTSARQFKILQSSRAPAQLTLALRPGA